MCYSIKRFGPVLLFGLFLVLLGHELAFTQTGARKGKGRGPDFVFDRIAGGKDSFDVNTVEIPPRMVRAGESADQKREQWRVFLQKKGITNGQMTRELFHAFFADRTAQAAQKRQVPKVVAIGSGEEGSAAPTGKAKGADFYFDRYAGGKDMFDVNTVEIPPRMIGPRESAEQKRDQWRAFLEKKGVTNGLMTRELFRSFYEAQTGRPSQPARRRAVTIQPREEGDQQGERRPIVYRVGKLPKGLPSWFAELDTDKDGQIGLYEWKAAGRSVSEFLAMDQNGDGFLTVEEILRYQKVHKKAAPAATAAPTSSTATSSK
jgi:hypothetical protein